MGLLCAVTTTLKLPGLTVVISIIHSQTESVSAATVAADAVRATMRSAVTAFGRILLILNGFAAVFSMGAALRHFVLTRIQCLLKESLMKRNQIGTAMVAVADADSRQL
jgi:hypothetical protein